MKDSKIDRRTWYKREFFEISKSIQNKESLTMYDFLRIRNFKLNNLSIESEKNIIEQTREAFKPNIPIKQRLKILVALYGVRIPVASAILAMRFPDQFAIIDQNVIFALVHRKKIDKEVGREWYDNYIGGQKSFTVYEDYLKVLKMILANNKEKSLREIEIDLFEEGKKIGKQVFK